MKTMSCKQLGGACEKEFRASTFEEMAALSQQHGMDMYEKKDEAHIEAMQAMQDLMKDSKKMSEWFESKRKEFEGIQGS